MSDAAREAKADAKAAKAKAKALRPWFKKKRFLLPIILVVIIGFSVATNGNKGSSSSDNAGSADSSSTAETMAAIGDVVTDDDWSLSITKFSCGIDRVGSDLLGADAQGQFCIANISATNNGDKADYLVGDNHKIYSADGKEYSSDSSNWIYLKDNMLLEKVNPGNTSKGQLLFDVPKDADLSYIELHASMFSGGVKVSLK